MPGLRSPCADSTKAEDGRAASLSIFTKRRETWTSPAKDFVSLLATERFQGADSAGGSQIKRCLACYVWRWRCYAHPRTDEGRERNPAAVLDKVPAATLQRCSGARLTVSRVETTLFWLCRSPQAGIFISFRILKPFYFQPCIFMFTIDIFIKEWNLWATAQKHEGCLQ